VVGADRAAEADIGVAIDAEEDERFGLESGIGEQSGQVLAGLGVLGVVLYERPWPVVAAVGDEVFSGADEPYQAGVCRGCGQGCGDPWPFTD
jgi:hypothetical protein